MRRRHDRLRGIFTGRHQPRPPGPGGRGPAQRLFLHPLGAEVIGWEGVDGIHCCFVEGFGEMVFAVNPMGLPGDWVHPIARDFEELLRLLLSCGHLAALEQAHGWDREQFDQFLKDDPPAWSRPPSWSG